MRWGAFTLLSTGVLASSTVRAESPSLNLRNFDPPMDPGGSLALEPVATPGHGNFGASLWTSYAYRVVRIDDADGNELAVPIRHQLSYDALFNWGFGNRWALGLALPVVAYQSGKRYPGDDWVLPKTALGDPTLELKAAVVPKGELGGYGVAAYSRVTLPLGSEASGVGAGAATAQLGLRGELDLILLGLRASAGYVFRAEKRVFLGDQFGNYAPWALGLFVKPQLLGWDKEGRWQWYLEGHGAVAVTPEFATKHSSPAALGLGARYTLGADMSAISGIELPLDGAVGVPTLRAVIGIAWAPRFLDADGDGIADDADDCPEEMPEDRDGFQDDDGCPDDDHDGDGVSEQLDRCPREPEDFDEFRDDDGCPDPDNDADSILDTDDACSMEAGVPSKSKKYNGCPRKDTDNDGILDDIDRCPERAEDLDGRHDQDGCPDPDDDADGILDTEDDCPTQRGPRRTIKSLNGCPNPDQDEDTFFGTVGDGFEATGLFEPDSRPVGTARDACPQEAEDFDGDRDDDGCADPTDSKKKTTALLSLELAGNDGKVKFARALKWRDASSVSLRPEDIALLRALAKELLSHRDWTALVGVRPQDQKPEHVKLARDRATVVVRQLKRLTLRESSATVVDFTAVADVPFAQQSGLGISLRVSSRRQSPILEPPLDKTREGAKEPSKEPEESPANSP